MRKLLLPILIFILCLTGCSTSTKNSADGLSVVVTSYPIYDWVSHIVTEDTEVVLLMEGAADSHNYQPSTEDMLKLAECDVFIYTGGASDAWVESTLKTVKNEDLHCIKLVDILHNDLLMKTSINGIPVTTEEKDEHVWLSLTNAIKCIDYISTTLSEKYPDHVFLKSVNNYTTELEDLHQDYVKKLQGIDNPAIVFAGRFPFRYFCNDYGITFYAAFNGCSAESEASFETVMFLANKIKELNTTMVGIVGESDLIQTLAETSGKTLTTATFMNGLSGEMTYYDTMKHNLEQLIKVVTNLE